MTEHAARWGAEAAEARAMVERLGIHVRMGGRAAGSSAYAPSQRSQRMVGAAGASIGDVDECIALVDALGPLANGAGSEDKAGGALLLTGHQRRAAEAAAELHELCEATRRKGAALRSRAEAMQRAAEERTLKAQQAAATTLLRPASMSPQEAAGSGSSGGGASVSAAKAQRYRQQAREATDRRYGLLAQAQAMDAHGSAIEALADAVDQASGAETA